MATFINPFVDRGFKILFGKEDSKELLIDLLNDLLEGERVIRELSFMNVESQGECTDSRLAVFDLKCKDQDGTVFIVEVQNSLQRYFFDRALYYLCRMICDQDRRGDEWRFAICPVYGIFFLNFESKQADKVRTDVVLADRETGQLRSDKIRQIFIEMPLFNKTEAECQTGLDYWLYTLKHMEQLEYLPFKGQKEMFEKLEKLAKIVNLNKKERDEYDELLKVYRDNKNTWEYAIENGFEEGQVKGMAAGLAEGKAKGLAEGKAKGLAEGKAKGLAEGKAAGMAEGLTTAARAMKQKGMDIASIMDCTGLDAETIATL